MSYFLTAWGDLVARYGFGQVFLVLICGLIVMAACGMGIAGLLAVRALRYEDERTR